MDANNGPELEFYRAVEDLFSTLRGVPHILSPKDFQLLRTWWKDRVPLSAVRTGVTEVFARRRERGESEPVVSLAYCRHAVEKHAKRLAEMRIGAEPDPAVNAAVAPESIRHLAQSLRAAAKAIEPKRPRVAAVVERISGEVDEATEIDGVFVEDHLYALETTLLADCLDALDDTDRERLEGRARDEAAKVAANPEALDRTYRALRDRLLRTLLDLPRLEIGE